MKAYYCLPIISPPTDDDVAKYKATRLLALKTDPHAFGSNYEREARFSDEQWKGRIGTDQIITIAARYHAQPPSSGGASMVESWAGIASILTPRFLQSMQVPLPSHTHVGDLDVYVIVGMWVRPEHRRRGVGKILIEAGIEAMLRDKSENSRKSLMLEVYDKNEAGKSLYLNNGFTTCEGPGSEGGKIWMQKLIPTIMR